MTAAARPLKRGYRGFADWNGEIGRTTSGSEVFGFTGISTSHGYQFNPNLFVGGGLWVQGCTFAVDKPGLGMVWFVLPVFLQTRADFTLDKYPVFVDLRLGGNPLFGFNPGDGDAMDRVFFAPSVGVRKAISDRVSWNLGVGVSVHAFIGDGEGGCAIMPAVRVGFDF